MTAYQRVTAVMHVWVWFMCQSGLGPCDRGRVIEVEPCAGNSQPLPQEVLPAQLVFGDGPGARRVWLFAVLHCMRKEPQGRHVDHTADTLGVRV